MSLRLLAAVWNTLDCAHERLATTRSAAIALIKITTISVWPDWWWWRITGSVARGGRVLWHDVAGQRELLGRVAQRVVDEHVHVHQCDADRRRRGHRRRQDRAVGVDGAEHRRARRVADGVDEGLGAREGGVRVGRCRTDRLRDLAHQGAARDLVEE